MHTFTFTFPNNCLCVSMCVCVGDTCVRHAGPAYQGGGGYLPPGIRNQESDSEPESAGSRVYLNRSEINFGIRVLCTRQT